MTGRGGAAPNKNGLNTLCSLPQLAIQTSLLRPPPLLEIREINQAPQFKEGGGGGGQGELPTIIPMGILFL